MTDRRLTPANGRVAAAHLKGVVTADTYVAGTTAQISVPVADLCAAPGGARDRQRLLGAPVTVYETRDDWAFVQGADGYVGYLQSDQIGSVDTPTHRVSTLATHAYAEADFKSPDLMHLSFGATLRVLHEGRRFFETPQGHVPKSHLRPLDRPFSDPVNIAQLHFGVPYLWGGNSALGIDCSGLVSAALEACDIPTPADSDMQRALGQSAASDYRRGDLLFWDGHVAIVVDPDTLIHANAHHMATAYEPIEAAMIRIKAQGDGPLLAHRRL